MGHAESTQINPATFLSAGRSWSQAGLLGSMSAGVHKFITPGFSRNLSPRDQAEVVPCWNFPKEGCSELAVQVRRSCAAPQVHSSELRGQGWRWALTQHPHFCLISSWYSKRKLLLASPRENSNSNLTELSSPTKGIQRWNFSLLGLETKSHSALCSASWKYLCSHHAMDRGWMQDQDWSQHFVSKLHQALQITSRGYFPVWIPGSSNN